MSGHKLNVWAQSCLGTIMSGHNRVWAQSCLGTVVWAQSCMGTNVVEPHKIKPKIGSKIEILVKCTLYSKVGTKRIQLAAVMSSNLDVVVVMRHYTHHM